MISTKNCIICYKKATEWAGHIHDEEIDVLAGFCNDHFTHRKLLKPDLYCQGCFGKYKPEMELI